MNTNTASTFLLLPLEIRWDIFNIVLSSETPPPQDPTDIASGDRSEERLFQLNVHYPKTFRRTCPSLLLTCKQIHNELQHQHAPLSSCGYCEPACSRRRNPRCKLDLMVTWAGVWPTWIQPPLLHPSQPYDHEVDLGLFDVTCPFQSTFLDHNRWLGNLIQPVMAILNLLLASGPQFSRPVPDIDVSFPVDHLVLRVHYCVSNAVGPYEILYQEATTPERIWWVISDFFSRLNRQQLVDRKVRKCLLIDEVNGFREDIDLCDS